MDARAMEEHDWDECGDEIASLFEGDPLKRQSISDAWYDDLDSEEQELIHGYVCENKRGPEGLEAVQRFEKWAAEREERLRKYQEERKKRTAERRASQETLVKQMDSAAETSAGVPMDHALEAVRNAIRDAQAKLTTAPVGTPLSEMENFGTTISSSTTAMTAGDIRYKTENAW